jgi:hypothetical protein
VASRFDFGGKAISPKDVPHLRAAFENGVAQIDIDRMDIKKINA